MNVVIAIHRLESTVSILVVCVANIVLREAPLDHGWRRDLLKRVCLFRAENSGPQT
jgi:hypothetical protein